MRERSASSSDIELARELSRRLAGRGKATASVGDRPADPGYRRFCTTVPPAPAPIQPPPEPPAVPVPATPPAPPVPVAVEEPGEPAQVPQPPTGMTTWEEFLAWSLSAAHARAAFVVDSQGFVISSHGNLPADGFEGLGAELCLAMEQLERIDPEAGGLSALELVFQNRRIVGVRAVSEEEGSFVVGFVVSAGVSDEAQRIITKQLEESLSRLD